MPGYAKHAQSTCRIPLLLLPPISAPLSLLSFSQCDQTNEYSRTTRTNPATRPAEGFRATTYTQTDKQRRSTKHNAHSDISPSRSMLPTSVEQLSPLKAQTPPPSHTWFVSDWPQAEKQNPPYWVDEQETGYGPSDQGPSSVSATALKRSWTPARLMLLLLLPCLVCVGCVRVCPKLSKLQSATSCLARELA
ncbi:uncharacterized protein J3D65DRAFT_601283 [Phyllosticta citribraziliensis]|uniref:Uncharacterized protein n=1 Tax=Phyllosticta citribraziliensis TaxID=989973 RepID=A0ABR1M2J1_9PEZI